VAAPPRSSDELRKETPERVPATDYFAVGPDETFSQCLYRLMRQTGTSQAQLANRSWLDRAYVNRLVNTVFDPLNPRVNAPRKDGRSRQPSRDTVIRLGLAMQLAMEDMEELLLAAGYAPLVR